MMPVVRRLTFTAACLVLLTQAAHGFVRNAGVAVGRPFGTRLHLFDFLNQGKIALVKQLAGDYDAQAVRSRLDNMINDNPVLMLSFTTCPYCIKAKACLDEKGAKYKAVELDVDDMGKAMRAELGDLVGRTSMPAIWIDGKFVGGCNDGPMGGVLSLNANGQLDAMLKEVGAV